MSFSVKWVTSVSFDLDVVGLEVHLQRAPNAERRHRWRRDKNGSDGLRNFCCLLLKAWHVSNFEFYRCNLSRCSPLLSFVKFADFEIHPLSSFWKIRRCNNAYPAVIQCYKYRCLFSPQSSIHSCASPSLSSLTFYFRFNPLY